MAPPVQPSGSTPTTVPETPAEIEKKEYRPGSFEAQLHDNLQDVARCGHLSSIGFLYDSCAKENDPSNFQKFFGEASQWIQDNLPSVGTVAAASDAFNLLVPGSGAVSSLIVGAMTVMDYMALPLSERRAMAYESVYSGSLFRDYYIKPNLGGSMPPMSKLTPPK